jgi:beta-galactosidase
LLTMVIIASAGLTRGDSAHGADSGRQTSGGGRVLLPLDTDWRFQRAQAEEAVSEGFDDSKWQKITLPHTFNGADGEDGGDYYRGPGWYRRRLILTESLAGRRAFLQFDGAALTTDVYVNGTLAGRHEGGYAGFRIDVTPQLRRGENRIAVRVDNTKVPHIAPLGGDFTVFGGLYRRVFLLLTPEVHVDTLDYGGPGIYVSTSEVRAGISARFSITVRVRNDRVRTATVLIASSVLDADGKVVAETQRRMIVPAASTAKAMMAGTISEPRLWDGTRDPYLYRVVTEVRDVRARRQADAVTVPLGVRTVAIDPQRGFLLNGKPLGVHGVNLFHSGRPGRGLAVTDAEIRQDLAILKELNVTGVRFVHFQHPQLAYEEADRLGFIVWTEIPLNGAVDSGPAFEENITQQMRELIRQNYNHPSVAVWGLGNEVYASTADVNRILDSVQRVAKLEDASRPTAYAHCCQSDDNEKALHSDVGAFNRYFGWYPEQKGQIGAWAESFHQRFPERAFAVSEYGAGASIRHQEDPPRPPVPASGWHPEQYQALFHETSWRQLQPLHYIWGTFVWVAFDLASDGRSEGDRPGINDKGLVTYDRAVKKDAFFWYQANWSTQPMLHLTSARLELRSVEEVEVKVYTNVDRVTLEVDGVGRGVVDVSDHIARWPRVKLHAGENRIQVRATADGREFTDSAVWTYQKSLVETAR